MTQRKNTEYSTDRSADDSLTYQIDADERPSEAVVRAVAELTGSAITDIEPLYYVGIDPEDLDGLFEDPEASAIGDRSLTLSIHGCTVTVQPGEVVVELADDEAS